MPIGSSLLDWCCFAAIILVTGLIDRALYGKEQNGEVSVKEATIRSLLWLGAGLELALWIWWHRGVSSALSYLTAYLVEKSLSVDNLFVFLVIFKHFGVRDKQQERVLFWGVMGAVVLRALFIVAGAELLHHFWLTSYIFGAFLVFSGLKLGFSKSHDAVDPSKSFIVKTAQRYLRTTPHFDHCHFLTRQNGVWHATPLLLVLLVIEVTDLMFAVDSVPAVLAISQDLFIVYTSNVLAILGLRALYFLLAGMMDRFRFLDLSLAAVLVFVGAKMLCHPILPISNGQSLGIIAGLLCLGIVGSLCFRPAKPTN